MRSAVPVLWISRCFESVRDTHAQASVEAAVLLPAFLIIILLALQPVCVLYTRAVMESAAAETARLMITAPGDEQNSYKAFTLRRLAAVPDVSIFHVGGPLTWDISLTPSGSGSTTRVCVKGRLKPLPVIGVFATALGKTNEDGDVEVSAEVAYEGRPGWLEGSYESWISVWD
ncbi:TadE family protein [Coriobacterium glomerans PW2]|uniref:TadE family protein n=1 Tax=Coriobacterium glomerans (strain ATCC 49209 / DSM 20642 / JCM 10262 / PW2) TaxID=700015 RepID=F2NA70_CORGP|nr:TadE family protein [Coriobacterium glomerans]AEB06464.1 TadE family protein [Coriobacterium glomerans PW2]